MRVVYMFERIKSLWVNDIGIDLGTMNTLVWVSGEGIVLDEPSYVAINADTNKVRAVGAEAKRMMAMTAERIKVIRPVRDGVIANAEVSDEMLRSFIRRASGRYKIMKPRVLIAVPSGITEVGIRTVKESAISAGARAVRLVEEPFASALGAGLPVEEPDSNMIVDIGGGTTEVAVISLGCIVAGTSVPNGGDAMDDAIIAFMQKEHQLLIGPRTAERIKIEIGSAYQLPEQLTIEVKGLDMGHGGDRLPRAVIINSDEVRNALATPVANIVKAIRKTIDMCPPRNRRPPRRQRHHNGGWRKPPQGTAAAYPGEHGASGRPGKGAAPLGRQWHGNPPRECKTALRTAAEFANRTWRARVEGVVEGSF